MRLRVDQSSIIAERIRRLRLVAPDGGPLPSFVPGAYIELSAALPGGQCVRPYSLVSSPNDLSAYEVAVLHVEGSRGMSRFVHEALEVGDPLDVSPPRGAFQLAEHGERHTLIAGGIGITPIFALAMRLRALDAHYHVHYAARTPEKMAFARELEDRLGSHTTFYFDRDGASSLDLDAALSEPEDGHHVYVCGPRSMIEGVRRITSARGWRPDHVHFETFGARSAARRHLPVTVRLEQSDLTVHVEPGQSILEAMEEAGAWVSSDCRRGECGKCTVGYSAGEVEHLDVCLTEEARRTQLCPCVSRALSDVLVVDA